MKISPVLSKSYGVLKNSTVDSLAGGALRWPSLRVFRLGTGGGDARAVARCTFLRGRLVEENTALIDDLGQRVTAATANISVYAFQRENRARGVIEARGLPFLRDVTPSATCDLGGVGKLTAVRVHSMAICALLEGDRLLEVSALMTFCACNGSVFAKQRVLRSAVVEVVAQCGGSNRFPPRRRMTALAS